MRIDYHAGATHTYGGAACGTGGGKLGASLALYSDSQTFYVLVAGAPAMVQGAQALAGEAYVYVPIDGTITKLDTLKADSPGFLDAFGGAVALDATHIYVGGPGRVKSGVGRTGSVSVFAPSGLVGWSLDTELFPGSGAAGDLCGTALSARHEADGVVAMGCPGHDGLVDNEGAVRVLQEFDFLGTSIWSQDRLDMPLVRERIRDRLRALAEYLGDADWLDGAFSAGDLLMIAVLLRVKPSGLLAEFSSLVAYVARGEARPAYQRAFAAQLAVFTDSVVP